MDNNLEPSASDPQGIDEFSRTAERERQIAPDRILAVVGNKHRRAVIDSLNSTPDKTLEYDALVDRVADRVRDDNAAEVSDEHRQRIRIALRHVHLPKLEETEIIDDVSETGHIKFVGGELELEILTLLESYDVLE